MTSLVEVLILIICVWLLVPYTKHCFGDILMGAYQLSTYYLARVSVLFGSSLIKLIRVNQSKPSFIDKRTHKMTEEKKNATKEAIFGEML